MLVFECVAVREFLCLSTFILQVVTGRGLGLFAVFFGALSVPDFFVGNNR